jgi:hypothetical protein
MSDEPTVFRPGAVSYLRIPAPDAARLAEFYQGRSAGLSAVTAARRLSRTEAGT